MNNNLKYFSLQVGILGVFVFNYCYLSQKAEGQIQYSYDPSNKADPFHEFAAITTQSAVTGPLQRYDVTQIRLVGTIMGDDVTALISLPDGSGHVVHIGEHLGKRGGRVLTISRTKLVVREPAAEFSADGSFQKFNDMVLELRRYDSKVGDLKSIGTPDEFNPSQLPFTLFPRGENRLKTSNEGAVPQIIVSPPPERLGRGNFERGLPQDGSFMGRPETFDTNPAASRRAAGPEDRARESNQLNQLNQLNQSSGER